MVAYKQLASMVKSQYMDQNKWATISHGKRREIPYVVIEAELPNGENPSSENVCSIDRQNEAAQTLSEYGFDVAQLSNTKKAKSLIC